jgi:hypothetical protein
VEHLLLWQEICDQLTLVRFINALISLHFGRVFN